MIQVVRVRGKGYETVHYVNFVPQYFGVITGGIGSGKTYIAVRFMMRYLRKNPRAVVLTNIELSPEFPYYDRVYGLFDTRGHFAAWRKYPKLVVLDEAGTLDLKEVLEFFRLARKTLSDVLVIDQRWRAIYDTLQYQYDVINPQKIRVFGVPIFPVKSMRIVHTYIPGVRISLNREVFRFDKRVFSYYDSFSMPDPFWKPAPDWFEGVQEETITEIHFRARRVFSRRAPGE